MTVEAVKRIPERRRSECGAGIEPPEAKPMPDNIKLSDLTPMEQKVVAKVIRAFEIAGMIAAAPAPRRAGPAPPRPARPPRALPRPGRAPSRAPGASRSGRRCGGWRSCPADTSGPDALRCAATISALLARFDACRASWTPAAPTRARARFDFAATSRCPFHFGPFHLRGSFPERFPTIAHHFRVHVPQHL